MKLEYNHSYKALDNQGKLCLVLKYTGSITESSGFVYHCFDTLWQDTGYNFGDTEKFSERIVNNTILKPLNSAEEAIYG